MILFLIIVFLLNIAFFQLYITGLFNLKHYDATKELNNIKDKMPFLYDDTTLILYTTKKISLNPLLFNRKEYVGVYFPKLNIIIVYSKKEIELTLVHEFAHRYFFTKITEEEKLYYKELCNCEDVNEFYAQEIEKTYNNIQ